MTSKKKPKSGVKSLLDHASMFREENSKQLSKPVARNDKVDEMIVNLGNPRLAEKMRINQVFIK